MVLANLVAGIIPCAQPGTCSARYWSYVPSNTIMTLPSDMYC